MLMFPNTMLGHGTASLHSMSTTVKDVTSVSSVLSVSKSEG